MQEIKIEERSLFYELYLHFNIKNAWLMNQYKKLDDNRRRILTAQGERLINEAKCNGVKRVYYGNESLAIFSVLIMRGYDFKMFS